MSTTARHQIHDVVVVGAPSRRRRHGDAAGPRRVTTSSSSTGPTFPSDTRVDAPHRPHRRRAARTAGACSTRCWPAARRPSAQVTFHPRRRSVTRTGQGPAPASTCSSRRAGTSSTRSWSARPSPRGCRRADGRHGRRACTATPAGGSTGVVRRPRRRAGRARRARFVVGADGLRSRVARSVGAAGRRGPRADDGATQYAYYAGIAVARHRVLRRASGALAGVFPTHDGAGAASGSAPRPADAARPAGERAARRTAFDASC